MVRYSKEQGSSEIGCFLPQVGRCEGTTLIGPLALANLGLWVGRSNILLLVLAIRVIFRF
jgi:hypothetical protein